MNRIYVLIIFVCFFFSLRAEILEIDQIDDVRAYVDQKALVLVDIDETLISTPVSLGSSVWRNWLKAQLANYNTEFVLYDALTLYIAKHIHYKAVEPSTAQLIRDWQEEGLAIFAFTARGRSQWYTTDLDGVDEFTHEQLRYAGIDFEKTIIPNELQNLESTYFYNGIIFAQHIKKGDLLKHLLKDLNYRPSRIVFIDDKLDQVQSVEAIAKEAGIPYFGFWYRRSENDGANFNPLAASIQLEYLLLKDQILTDEEADSIAETSDLDAKQYFDQIFLEFDISQIKPQLAT